LRLLVDTTYLLPAIGISVKGIPSDGMVRLIEKEHEICVSDISIFELSAKGAKHVAAGTLSGERVARGIRAVVHDGTVTMIPFHESTLLLTAFKLRNILSDFIDCLILASAIHHSDMLITEDDDIIDIKNDEEFILLYKRVNPKFKIQKLTEII